MATKLEQKGRKGDKLIAHLTPGEIVIPRALAEDDDFRGVIAHFMKENGAVPEQFIVGSGKNNINPETGYMEFGYNPFKKVKKWFKKRAKDVLRPFEKTMKEIGRAITPAIPKPPPLPDPIPTPEVSEDVADAAMRSAVRRSGRAGTILTGNLRPVSTKKKFLG